MSALILSIFCNYTWHLLLNGSNRDLESAQPLTKISRGQLKCGGTRAETTFHLSAKRTSLFKSAWALVQLTTGSRGVRIRGSNAGYTMFRGSMKGTGYPLHSPVSPSLPLLCVTVCHHISTGIYQEWWVKTTDFRAEGIITFMCRLSWNLEASSSWNPKGFYMSVQGLLYLFIHYMLAHLLDVKFVRRNVNDSQRHHVYKRSISTQYFAARTPVR